MKRVRAKWIIKFNGEGKLIVKVNDRIEVGEVLGEEVNWKTEKVDMSAEMAGLSKKKLVDLKLLIGKKVEAGELLVATGGWFGKKILSKISGKIVGIDEFGNMEYLSGEKNTRKIVSPVRGVIEKLDKDDMVIEFSATAFDGEGKEPGKVWANGLVTVEKMSDIGADCEGKVVIIKSDNELLIKKIEAIGGVGLIVKSARIESSLPTLIVSDQDFEKLTETNRIEKRLLLNTVGGRLLLVE